MYGEWLAVGAYAHDGSIGNNSGAVYIFKRTNDTWSQQQKIIPADNNVLDNFGYTADMYGDYLIVSAYSDDASSTDSGSAYIYYKDGSTWSQQQKITASDGAASDHFGMGVSIYGDYALVGAWKNDVNSVTNAGSAYVYVRDGTTWSQQTILYADTPHTANDYFGVSVSLYGEYAAVGAFYEDGTATDTGSAYIFKRTGTSWSKQAKLTASDAGTLDYFGYGISMYGNFVAVGAKYDDDAATNAGAVYIFKRSDTSWTQQLKVTGSNATTSEGGSDAADSFGTNVSFYGNYLLISSQGNDTNGTDSGSAYVFTPSDIQL